MKKNLGKVIALSLLTASVFSMAQCQVGYCELAIHKEGNDLVGVGEKCHGLFLCSTGYYDTETVYSGYSAYNNEKYNNINIVMNLDSTKEDIDVKPEIDSQIKSATALQVNSNAKVSCEGNVFVLNSSKMNPEKFPTINGIYARGEGADKKAEIDFSNANSVYINSILNGEKGDAVTAKKYGQVSISTKNKDCITRIIGDIDFNSNDVNGTEGSINYTEKPQIEAKNGQVDLAISNAKSFWYGDEQNLYEEKDTNVEYKWADFKEKYPTQANMYLQRNPDVDEADLLKNADFRVKAIGHGTFNFTLEKGGEWIYIENPNISNVKLKDGGIINLADKEISEKFTAANQSFKTTVTGREIIVETQLPVGEKIMPHRYIRIYNLGSGDKDQGGIFKLDLQYNDASKQANYKSTDVGDKSDYIFVKNGSGIYDVQFELANSKLEDMQNGDKLYFANDESKGVTFVSSTVDALPEKNSASDIYNYKYAVDSADAEENHQGTDWFITLNENGTNENITSVDGAMKAGYALGTEMDRLNKRLGESRYLSDEKGLWVRYRHARVGMDNSFKTNSNMFQLGYDKQVLEDDGTHYRGLALDYTHGDTSLLGLRGNGEHDRYSLSLYDTWTGDKGHYRDLVIRGGRINSEFDVDNSFSETISSDYHQWFGSISGEWGRKKDTGHDWYFEPQTQLQLARVGGADYVTNHDVRVEQDGATSLIGRLGFRLGREFDKNDAAKRDNYYIKADLMHEFCGDQEYRVTGKDGSLSKTYDGKDTWFDVGVGADITISRNTYFWVDVERTLGGDFDRTWQVNGGFRWEF